jgi:hypothetical protein
MDNVILRQPISDAIAQPTKRGTIFPGLIELHNHLSYNALPLWSPVPKRFENRGQWPNHKDYRPLVSGPMTVLGSYKDAQGRFPFVPALIRYVEAKCLLGGVTTTQGVTRASPGHELGGHMASSKITKPLAIDPKGRTPAK